MENKDNYSRAEVIGMIKAQYRYDVALANRIEGIRVLSSLPRVDEEGLLREILEVAESEKKHYESSIPLEIRAEIK